MQKRLLVTFLPLSLIPLAGAGLLSYNLAKRVLTEKAFSHLESIASLQKREVKSFIDQNFQNLSLTAERLQIRILVDHLLPTPTPNNLKKITQLLEKNKSTSMDFKDLSILSSNGIVIASTNKTLLGQDYSQKELFTKGKLKNRFDVADIDGNQRYVSYFSGPIRQENTLLGVLYIEEDMGNLFSWINNYSGAGETGETFLVKKLTNTAALFLTPLRFDPSATLKKRIFQQRDVAFFRVLTPEEGPIMTAVDYRGHPIIATARFLKALDWMLVVKIDQEEAFASIAHLRNMFIIFFLLTISSVIFLTHLLAKSIVDPIRELTVMAQDLQNGKQWPDNLISKNKNEIGILANALTTMAKNLFRAKEELEQIVNKRTEELRQSRSFMKSVIENIPNMIFVKSADNLKFVSLNKAGEDLLGMKREELIGKNDYDFFPQEEADFFVAKDRQVLDKRTLVDISEEPIQTKKYGIRILHTKKIPIFDEKGAPKYLLGISEDITERIQTEEVLSQKHAELARAHAQKEQLELFASVAAHDLQEPLKKIVAFGDLLQTECAKSINQEGQDYLQRMRNAAKRMSELISDLLKFSKVTTMQNALDKVDLSSVISEVISDLELRIVESKAEIKVGTLPILYSSRVHWREVFQNLIGNAIKFRKKNIPPIIHIDSRELIEGDIEITIQDNGIGFDEKFAEKIFKPFERLHRRVDYEGSGVGLAICRRIISNHGGRITAKSEVGHGTIFIIKLPKNVCFTESLYSLNDTFS